MDTSLIGIIGTILGSVDLIAVVSLLLFYKPNRKAKEIENDTHGNEALQSVISTLREQLERSDADSKAKQEIIDSLREENGNLKLRNIQLEQEKTTCEFWKCTVHGCVKRQPPNGL